MSKLRDYIDSKSNSDNEFEKTQGQFIRFVLISVSISVIQIVLILVLPLLFKRWTTPLGPFLGSIFSEDIIGEGNSNWGYIFPYFLSLLVANTVGYILNKKRNFKSDAPKWHFIIYFVALLVLIIISTWLQGVVVYFCERFMNETFSRIVGSLIAGIFMALALFPLQKYVLLKEKKKEE